MGTAAVGIDGNNQTVVIAAGGKSYSQMGQHVILDVVVVGLHVVYIIRTDRKPTCGNPFHVPAWAFSVISGMKAPKRLAGHHGSVLFTTAAWVQNVLHSTINDIRSVAGTA